MINFAWPWLLCLLPLPILVWRFLPAVKKQNDAALRVPFVEDFTKISPNSLSEKQGNKLLLIASLCWIALIIAAARPVWQGAPIALKNTGRDLLMAVDLSGSMKMDDFVLGNQRVTRLMATKKVAGEFITRRKGDRIGLILFGTKPYVQVPLTFDRTSVLTLLNEAAIGLAGEKTAIGDAIVLGIKRLQERPADQRVLILLTDGANTAGVIDPTKAAEAADKSGVIIYTVGIGADAMIVNSLFGRRKVNPSRDLDETALNNIAKQTGGKYFRARDTEELEKIYQIIDEIEPVIQDEQFFRPEKQLYYLPLAIALLLSTIIMLLRGRR